MELGNRENKRKAGVSIGSMLSVMELVIAIGVFAIISTFLLRFFTLANRLNEEAREISKACIKAESTLEYIKGTSFEEAKKAFQLQGEGEEAFCALDSSFERTEGRGSYMLRIERKKEAEGVSLLCTYKIRIMKEKDQSVVFALDGKTYEKAVKDE